MVPVRRLLQQQPINTASPRGQDNTIDTMQQCLCAASLGHQAQADSPVQHDMHGAWTACMQLGVPAGCCMSRLKAVVQLLTAVGGLMGSGMGSGILGNCWCCASSPAEVNRT